LVPVFLVARSPSLLSTPSQTMMMMQSPLPAQRQPSLNLDFLDGLNLDFPGESASSSAAPPLAPSALPACNSLGSDGTVAMGMRQSSDSLDFSMFFDPAVEASLVDEFTGIFGDEADRAEALDHQMSKPAPLKTLTPNVVANNANGGALGVSRSKGKASKSKAKAIRTPAKKVKKGALASCSSKQEIALDCYHAQLTHYVITTPTAPLNPALELVKTTKAAAAKERRRQRMEKIHQKRCQPRQAVCHYPERREAALARSRNSSGRFGKEQCALFSSVDEVCS